MSEACRLAGTATAEDGTVAAVCRASLSLSASKTAFVISSTKRGMPSVRSMMSCLIPTGSALLLEPISKSPEEDDEASELDEAEEVLGVILPAHKYAALPLDP